MELQEVQSGQCLEIDHAGKRGETQKRIFLEKKTSKEFISAASFLASASWAERKM